MNELFLEKIKKELKLLMLFKNESNESNCKSNKICLDKSSEFYNRSMKSLLQHNDIEVYSMHNEGKSVTAERFTRTLKNKICKYMTSISKNVYNDKLDDIVNKYNNTYHKTIKIKLVDVKSSRRVDSRKENNKKNPKLKIGDIVRISKSKNIFAKGYTPNWAGEAFVIVKVKNIVPWLMIIMAKKLLELFAKNNCKKKKKS